MTEYERLTTRPIVIDYDPLPGSMGEAMMQQGLLKVKKEGEDAPTKTSAEKAPKRLENSLASEAVLTASTVQNIQLLQTLQSVKVVVKNAVAEYDDLADSTDSDVEMLLRLLRNSLQNIEDVIKLVDPA